MALSSNGLNAAADGVAAVAVRLSAHTADPGSTGANEVAGGSYARQAVTWGSAAAGSAVGGEVAVPIPGSTTVTHVGLWNVAGDTFYGGEALDASESFGSAGTLNHTPTITATNP